MATILPNANDVTVDDISTQVLYSGDGWRTVSRARLQGGTQHISYKINAQFSLSFNASHVWYIADRNIDHGSFQVTVDDVPYPPGTSKSDSLVSNLVLFDAELDPSHPHTMTVRNLSDKKAFSIDTIVYRPIDGEQSSSSSATTPSPASDASVLQHSSHRAVPTGVIIGIVLGSIALLVLAAFAALIVHDWRKRRAHEQKLRAQVPHMAQAPGPPQPWTTFHPSPASSPTPGQSPPARQSHSPVPRP
ncbi:hypothetical protein EXIGLDRAFT_844221 [Exidia glandulosa HHB12029]|uniref:Uncharacterized protein n=1 Tax=Exidia glandulosa HHB12029 TaxID=1314781 RepID=A0A165C5S9_EXIGL|nr:hypothetical protein EXIGLDRAFT_844221 [Exidia glandulosa HHB12029]